MAPVFASPDIAALVAAFPPPLPTRDLPSLVRTLSGRGLRKSQKVLTQLRMLLETESRRIGMDEVQRMLDIENTDWLFDCYDGEIFYDQYGKTIVPNRSVDEIADELLERSKSAFIDIATFSILHAVALSSMESLVLRHTDVSDLRRVSSEGKTYVANAVLLETVEGKVRGAMAGSGSEKVDLLSSAPGVPIPIIRDIGRRTLQSADHFDGVIDHEGNKAAFIPSSWHDKQDQLRRDILEQELQQLVQKLELDGFCDLSVVIADRLEVDQTKEEVSSRYRKQNPDVELVTLTAGDKKPTTRAVVEASLLRQTMEQMVEAIDRLDNDRSNELAALDKGMERSLCSNATDSELAELVFGSREHHKTLEDKLAATATKIQLASREVFADLYRDAVLCPLQLYVAGLESVKEDATLREHQSEYLGEHFRREIIPSFKTEAKQENLLLDKARAREAEKLAQSCEQAKTLFEIQSVVEKFAKKQKVDAPSAIQLEKCRRQSLLQKIKTAKKTSRGSDVLQNLAWVLLARQLNGTLFISAGKDTTRMIRLLRSVGGDEGLVKKLEACKDGLKAGQQDETVRMMKQMVKEVEASMAEHV